MRRSRELVTLGDVLRPCIDAVPVDPSATYPMAGVYGFGRGLFARSPLDGSATTYRVLHRLHAGDLVMSQLKAWEGAMARVTPQFDGFFLSPQFPTFRAVDDRLDPSYLEWYSRQPSIWEALRRNARGMGARRDSVSPSALLSLQIPLPPLAEQRRIVARLDRLAELGDGVTHLHRSVGAQLEALMGAHLNRTFGDPYRGVEGTVGSHRLAVLGDVVADVADGPHKTPSYVEDGVPFVTVLNITTGRVSFRTVKYISEADHREYQKRARAERGDVLITKDGTIGIPCYVDTDREFSFFVSVALVKPRRELLDGQYLTWALRAPYLQTRMRERSRGDMITHLVLREIRALLLPLPKLDRQRQIVDELEAVKSMIDSSRRLHEERTDQAAALLRGELVRSFS